MDFWTYTTNYGAKNCKVTLVDGTTHCGYIYTQTFDNESHPTKVLQFSILKDDYERVHVRIEDLKEIELL